MSPRRAPARPPKPWERQSPGTYASADGRFLLEGDGAGRWFVRDAEQADELGLPRTLGPYATLADAKAAADAQRERPPEVSPLAARIAEAGARRATEPGADDRGGRGRAKPSPREQRTIEARLAPPPPPPPPPTWLDVLAAHDRDAASLARRRIRELEALGLPDAETTVRRDLEADLPVVAAALLVRALHDAVAARLGPGPLAEMARAAGVPAPEGSGALGALAVARTLEVMVDLIVNEGRLAVAPRDLPGWEVREAGPAGRRIRLTPGDLA